MFRPIVIVMEMVIRFSLMKKFLTFLLLSSSPVILAGEKYPGFTFPPFAKEDIKTPVHPLPDNLNYEELQAISIEEWRGMMTTGNSSVQELAAKELLARGDQKTILRLVYSLKQGNVFAIETLNASTLAVIPYLMEDIANGSLKYYNCYSFGDAVTSQGSVRQAAIERVASILANTPEFTGETKKNLREINRGKGYLVQSLSDKSRNLIQWWLLNEKAFEAGKWSDTQPLPYQIVYPDPGQDVFLPRGDSSNQEKQPPYGTPLWEVAESFEAWSERIVDPKRRNLDFVALSWDGKKVVEHPAKSLDPKAKPQNRESRKSSALGNPSESGSGYGSKAISWMILAAVLLVVFSIVWWQRGRMATRI